MGDAEFQAAGQSTSPNMSSKKKELLSTAMKRTSEWFDLLSTLILIQLFIVRYFRDNLDKKEY